MMKRRAFCLSVAGVALSVGPLRHAVAAGESGAVPYSSGTAPPKLAAPPNSADCHMHVYDSRFPAAKDATLRPPDATVDDYRLLQRRIGTTRVVVVTPSTYGTDNRCMVDALAKLGDVSRGVAVVDDSVSDRQLRSLADAGVCGIRFNLTIGGVTTLQMLEPLSRRVRDFDWHVQVNIAPQSLVENEELLRRLPSRIVLDHMARVPLGGDVNGQPAFLAVKRLVDRGNVWIKLSGAYLGSKVTSPAYADTYALGRAYVAMAPERMVWGSDWPHPTVERDKPDDAVLFDLLEQWAPDAVDRQRILVGNPEALYGFTH